MGQLHDAARKALEALQDLIEVSQLALGAGIFGGVAIPEGADGPLPMAIEAAVDLRAALSAEPAQAAGTANKIWHSADLGDFSLRDPGDEEGWILYVPASHSAQLVPAAEPPNLTDPAVRKRLSAQWGYVEVDTLRAQLQQQCSDWQVYWRAPDAHGVTLSQDQALVLLRNALGVEVDFAGGSADFQSPAEGDDQAIELACEEITERIRTEVHVLPGGLTLPGCGPLPSVRQPADAAQPQPKGTVAQDPTDIKLLRALVVDWQYDKDCPAKVVKWIDERLAATQAPAPVAEPAPNDWRLPADLKAGHVTFGKGVHCSALVSRMKMLHETAFGVDNLTAEQKAENLAALQACKEPPHHFDPPPMTPDQARALIASCVICCELHDREPCPRQTERQCPTCPHRIARGEPKPPVQHQGDA